MGIFKNIGNKIKSGFNKFGNKLSSGITKGKQFWNKHGDTIASIGNGALRAAALVNPKIAMASKVINTIANSSGWNKISKLTNNNNNDGYNKPNLTTAQEQATTKIKKIKTPYKSSQFMRI